MASSTFFPKFFYEADCSKKEDSVLKNMFLIKISLFVCLFFEITEDKIWDIVIGNKDITTCLYAVELGSWRPDSNLFIYFTVTSL